jgi:hypothetical protein
LFVNRNVAVIALIAAGLAATAVVIIITLMDAPEREAPATVSVPAAATGPIERSAPSIPPPPPAAPEPARRRAAPAPAATPAAAPSVVAEAAPTAGLLRIDSDVPGAQVFIDRQFVGTAPAVAENVTPGTHQLNVSAQGFDSVATSIDVAPGEREIVVRLREVRLDALVEVIHKHGIGSCRGRLVATPQGIRYETSNRDDAFTSSLVDLETFQVDYLEKNLRVKLPKGRQFNFTDPEGNADRLFVFHRDVEKARERLKRGDPPATR